MSETNQISVREDTAITTPTEHIDTMDIKGLDEVPVSYIPLPFVKLISSNSKDPYDKDGNVVPSGKFLNTGNKNVYDKLSFHVLRAKPGTVTNKDMKTGELVTKDCFRVLAIRSDDIENLDATPFIMMYTGTAFWNFRSTLGIIKQLAAQTGVVWSTKIEAIVKPYTNKEGQNYQALDFGVKPAQLDEGRLAFLESLYYQWGGNLDRKEDSQDDEELDYSVIK